MSATVQLYVYTGTDAGTENGPVSGIDLISADNATNSLTNRQDNPIQAGSYSYEKWIRAKVDGAPDNYVENFKFWTDGDVDPNTTLRVGTTPTGATPTDSESSVATNDATNYTSGNKMTWHTNRLTSVGETTDFLVLQLEVGAAASAGNWSQETLHYSYDEA